jgi:hypothetical protein
MSRGFRTIITLTRRALGCPRVPQNQELGVAKMIRSHPLQELNCADKALGRANPAITLLVYSHFLKHAESDVAHRLAEALLNFPSASRTQEEIESAA